jgi:hypothetical protein
LEEEYRDPMLHREQKGLILLMMMMMMKSYKTKKKKKTSVALVRSERQPLVSEVTANFCG